MRKILIFLFVCLFINLAFSQKDILLKGKIINKNSKAVIPDVSVYIPGANTGTASGENGNFSIKIPESVKDDSVIFSCIGFKKYKQKISTLTKNITNLIKLEPQTVVLNEMVIIPSSDAIKILENTLETILSNLPGKPYEFEACYRELIEKNGKYAGFGEALFSGHSEGYNMSFAKDKYRFFPPGWFKINNCRVSDYQIIYTGKGFPRTNLMLHSIFDYDHYFITRSLLSKKWRKKQIFNYSSIDYKNGETVLVFQFTPKKAPKNKIIYSGNIYLSSNDYKVLKIEFFSYSKKILTHPFTMYNRKILYDTLTFNFIDIEGKSYVSNCTRKYKILSYEWDTLSLPDTILTTQKFIVKKIETRVLDNAELEEKYGSPVSNFDKIRYLTKPEINDKEYEYDPAFWNACSICINKPDGTWYRIEKELSTPDKSLTAQFIENKGQIKLSKEDIIFLYEHYNKKGDGYEKNYRSALLNCK